jgi:hypothetical protein
MNAAKLLFLNILFIVLVSTVITNAQVTVQVGGGLGYSLPSGDYGGETTGFYNGTEYGLESGFNLHAKARLGLLFINAFGEIGYTTFSGTGDAEEGRGTVDISHEVFTIKIGPEFMMSIPASPVTPYLMGFVSYNSFSGTVDFQGVSDVPSGEYDIASASRIGLGAGAGALFGLGVLNLDFSIQYHAMNVGGSEYSIDDPTSHERLDNYTSLNDAEDPLYESGSDDHFIGDSRSISAWEFKLSVLFGI